jgi:hypothetical protein
MKKIEMVGCAEFLSAVEDAKKIARANGGAATVLVGDERMAA